MIEGLAQGPYMVARVGFGPATFRTQGTEPATEPPRPTIGADVISDVSVKRAVFTIAKHCLVLLFV